MPAFVVRDRDRVLLRVPFGGLPTPYPYTLMLPQDVTEQVLAEHLTASVGTVRWGHRVTGIDGRAAKVAGPDGQVHEIGFRYLAGCDGMHSAVREQAG